MNERILELAEQAEISANKGDHVDVKLMMEKFAELIVRECMKVSMKSVGPDAEHEAWYLIKEHFGVEQ
jgi:hypothetical protein